MNDFERGILKDQIATDTIWCYACGLRGTRTKAACRYGVEDANVRVPSCPRCLQQARADGIKITDSEPVAQPQHVEVLERLIA